MFLPKARSACSYQIVYRMGIAPSLGAIKADKDRSRRIQGAISHISVIPGRGAASNPECITRKAICIRDTCEVFLEDNSLHYPFGTLKMAKRTLPLLIVSIKVPTKTLPPLTATSL